MGTFGHRGLPFDVYTGAGRPSVANTECRAAAQFPAGVSALALSIQWVSLKGEHYSSMLLKAFSSLLWNAPVLPYHILWKSHIPKTKAK